MSYRNPRHGSRHPGHPTLFTSSRFRTLQSKAYAAELVDLLRTIVASSNQFQKGSSALQQSLIVRHPRYRKQNQKLHNFADVIVNESVQGGLNITLQDTITCLPSVRGFSKTSMSLFVPRCQASATSQPSTVTYNRRHQNC